MSKHSFFFVLIFCAVLVTFAAVIATPTLSFDDLFIARDLPKFLIADGWKHTIWRFFTMVDVNQTEIRTYSLTRIIQLFTVALFGASAGLTMSFFVIVHALSGLLILRILSRALGDTLSAVLLAIAWVASPAVLPLLRTEHHWLYLIVPYYVLVGWLILNESRYQSAIRFFIGSALLTCVWMLGEAPIIPLLMVCAFWVLTSPKWKNAIYIGGQAMISVVLLGSYLAYQLIYINDPTAKQRFVARGFSTDGFWYFFRQLGENTKAVLGLPYIEADIQMMISGLHVADSWEVWLFMGILLIIWFSREKIGTSRSKINISTPLMTSIWLMWIGSLAIYFLMALFRAGAFPIRYSTAFFLFTPIALTLAVSAISRNLFFTRSTAAIFTCFTVAFSTVLTLRYEYTINEPNRSLLAKMKGIGLIVYYPDTPGFVKGVKPGPNYPGVTPLTSPGNGDPKKSFWTLSPMLEQYAGTVVGSECRLAKDGSVEILQGPHVMGIKSQDQVQIVGTEKSLSQICETQ